MKNYKNNIAFFILIALVLNANAMNANSKNASINTFALKGFSNSQQSDSPILFLRSFFKWYKTKVDYLNNHIYPIKMDIPNNAPYRINFNETEKYLSVLKSSGFFSDNYITYNRDLFKKIDLTLQKTKQDDGTVDGLDYDPIVHSQEPNSILENLNNIKLIVIKSLVSEITIKMQTPFDRDTYSLYYLKKTNGKYLIDKIDFLIAGVVQK